MGQTLEGAARNGVTTVPLHEQVDMLIYIPMPYGNTTQTIKNYRPSVLAFFNDQEVHLSYVTDSWMPLWVTSLGAGTQLLRMISSTQVQHEGTYIQSTDDTRFTPRRIVRVLLGRQQ